MMEEIIIKQSKQQDLLRSLDPNELPVYTKRFSDEDLEAQQLKYTEVTDVIHFFMDTFLSTISGDPFLIAITDSKGYILGFQGDPSIISTIRQLGIVEGVQFNDELGINSIDLCLRYKQPIQILGDVHHHKVLHDLACCSVPLLNKNNEEVIGSITLMMDIRFAHPHMRALLCTIVDSIERELLLRKQNTQLQILNQVLIDTNYYGVIITDELGTIIEMNDNSINLLCEGNLDKAGCLGSNVFELEPIGHYFERVIVHNEQCVGVELSFPLHDLTRYYILDVVPIYCSEHTLIRVAGSLRDITDMKMAEEMMRNTEKLIVAGQLAVSIAHEIRNPLTTVKGMVQLSSKQSNSIHYDLIMSELDRMNAIVSEFLILGRPQPERFRAEPCLPILEEVLSIFEMQASMNGITINYPQASNGLAIRCDRNQIKQVFLNVLKNAMDAMPFGGSIDIQIDVENGGQLIRFIDNGEGMTDKVLQRIGEPFHTTKPDGNGLGMMIVSEIMNSHKGNLIIKSEVGVGTTVDIFLPGL